MKGLSYHTVIEKNHQHIITKFVKKAFEISDLEQSDRLSTYLIIAERNFNVRYSLVSDSNGIGRMVIVIADEWACSVRAPDWWQAPGFEFRDPTEVTFQGDWPQFERDAVLLALS